MPTRYLGNMVIAMQAIAALLSSRAAGDVTLVVDDNLADLVRAAFGEDAPLLVYPRRAVASGPILARARAYLGFIRALRQYRYDIALDIDGSVVSARLMRMARARTRIGPDFGYRPRAYDRLVPVDQVTRHCFDDFTTLAAAIGVPTESPDYYRIPRVDTAPWLEEHSQGTLGLPAFIPRQQKITSNGTSSVSHRWQTGWQPQAGSLS